MEKISSILPSNRRIKSVDLEDSHPIRPGVPTFGRRVGTSAVADRVSLSRNAPIDALKDTLTYRNPKEAARAKMVNEISTKFFSTRLTPTKPEPSLEPLKIPDVAEEDLAVPEPESMSVSAEFEASPVPVE